MKKKLFPFFVVICSLFITSCKDFNKNKNLETSSEEKGSGQVLYLNETSEVQKIFPHSITDIATANIASAVFEGLVKFNPKNLSVEPCVAKSWSVDSSGLKYTFNLRDDVYFQNDACFKDGKGRLVTANDFVFSFELLCSNTNLNNSFPITFKDLVKGATNYYKNSLVKDTPASPSSIEGIKAINPTTLEITLERKDNSFLQILCSIATSVFAKEAFEKYGENLKIGSGPFLFTEQIAPNKKITLVKNNNYYLSDKNQKKLPYLDSVVVSFLTTQQAEFNAFKEGKLHVVHGLPSEYMNEFLASEMKSFQNQPIKYIMERSPKMSTQFYVFNTSKAPFNNKKLRQAFCYAIDKSKIIDESLKGQAAGPGIYGIVPQTFRDYPTTEIKGYEFNLEKAKKLLAEAGYPNGKGLEAIHLKLSKPSSRNKIVASEIQAQLKNNLNVDIDYEILPFAEKIKQEMLLDGDMFRTSWCADFPSPISFLSIAYGKNVPENINQPSFPNTSRFKNNEFDKLYSEALNTNDVSKSNQILAKAEQILMDEAPILVLWYDENFILMQASVKNYYSNAMEYTSFTEVYID